MLASHTSMLPAPWASYSAAASAHSSTESRLSAIAGCQNSLMVDSERTVKYQTPSKAREATEDANRGGRDIN